MVHDAYEWPSVTAKYAGEMNYMMAKRVMNDVFVLDKYYKKEKKKHQFTLQL